MPDRRKKGWRGRNKAPETAQQPTKLSRQHLHSIGTMVIGKLPEVIEIARHPCNVHVQYDVVYACLQRILVQLQHSSRQPRHEQVRALRRLIFGQGDVLLIARTGFGKSLIFHAYSILTRKITLQLVPLTKLGEEQLGDIRNFPGAVPCLIDAKSRTAERKLIERVGNGEFTHVLLGPEQASSRAFRKALKRTEFQSQIGLVAIDECHLVQQWETFRPAFTMLGQLRTILREGVVWFGCSATLDAITEDRVLSTAGFRRVGNNRHETTVMRTSVDRPDVSICITPLPKLKLTSWDVLWFLFANAFSDTKATPERIPKTIVFIDGRRKIHHASVWAMETLVRLTASYLPENQYSEHVSAGVLCVLDVVRIFTSNVSQYDRDATFHEFLKPTSKVRVVFATTTLGMGINIPDVDRVVTHDLPITNSVGDLWQRLGRGGRGEGRTSEAHVLLPYWLFNTEGKEPVARPDASQADSQSIPLSQQLTQKRPFRNLLPSDRFAARYTVSQLSQSMTPGDLSDIEDDTARGGRDGCDDDDYETIDSYADNSKKKEWSVQELKNRSNQPVAWFNIVNGSCHRRGFLRELGELKLPLQERRQVPKNVCCSACNPSLRIKLVYPPPQLGDIKKPRSGSHAAFILDQLDAFALKRATDLFSTPNTGYPMIPALFLDKIARWRLSHQLVDVDPVDMTSAQMCEMFPFLSGWPLLLNEGEGLARKLFDIRKVALDQRAQSMQTKADKRRAKLAQEACLQQSPSTTIVAPVDSTEAARDQTMQLDNEAAMRVAEFDAIPGRLVYPVLPAIRRRVNVSHPTTPFSAHRNHEFNADIGLLTPLSQTSKKRSHHMSTRTMQSRSPLSELKLADSNKRPKRTSIVTPGTPKSNKPLLTFTPTSSSGRKRVLSEKGKESYRH